MSAPVFAALLFGAPSPPPALPNSIFEMSGGASSLQVLATYDVRYNQSYDVSDVVAGVRESVYTLVNARSPVAVPLHDIAVSTEAPDNILPPRPPDSPARPPPPFLQ